MSRAHRSVCFPSPRLGVLAAGLLAILSLQTAAAEDDQPQSYTEIHTWVRGYTDVYPDGTRVTHPGYWRISQVPVEPAPAPQEQVYASSDPQCTTTVIQDGSEPPYADSCGGAGGCGGGGGGGARITVVAGCGPGPCYPPVACYAPTPCFPAHVVLPLPLPPLPGFTVHHGGFPLPPLPFLGHGLFGGGHGHDWGGGVGGGRGHGGGNWGGGAALHLGGSLAGVAKLAFLPLALLGGMHR